MSLFKRKEVDPEEFLKEQQTKFDQRNQALQDMFDEHESKNYSNDNHSKTGFENHIADKKDMFQQEDDWFNQLVEEARKK